MNPKTSLTLVLALLALVGGGPCGADDSRGERLRDLSATLTRAERLAGQDAPLAEQLFRAAVETAGSLGNNLLLARALDGLAAVSREAGRLDEAEALYARAITMWKRLLGPGQPRLAVSLHNLGALYLERGEPSRAIPPLRQALEIWVATLGPECPEARNTRRALKTASGGGERGP